MENETKTNNIDRGSQNPGRGSPMSMDRRLNTGMSRSMSDRHLSNNSPVPDRSLDRASPLLMRSISQSSRLSSRDKRTEFEPALDQLSTTGWSEANSESQVCSWENHQSEKHFRPIRSPSLRLSQGLVPLLADPRKNLTTSQ